VYPRRSGAAPPSTRECGRGDGGRGRRIELQFEAKRCIHSRFCVTWAPKVFLANVQGPLDPSGCRAGRATRRGVAHACPSGRDPVSAQGLGAPDEPVPAVNLASVREARTLRVSRGAADSAVVPAGFFAPRYAAAGHPRTSPYLRRLAFSGSASTRRGEPPSGGTDMLPLRAGWRAGDRSAGQRTFEGARQPRDHQRHRPRGWRGWTSSLPVPLRRPAPTNPSATARTRRSASGQPDPQARRSVLARGLPEDGSCGVGTIAGLTCCGQMPQLAPPETRTRTRGPRPGPSCAAPMTTVTTWPPTGTVAITGEGGRPPADELAVRGTPPHAAPLALMPPEALNRLTQVAVRGAQSRGARALSLWHRPVWC